MNVIVLAAPCVHVGYLGCCGSEWVHTPHLDRLASEAIVFDQHYADCPLPRSQFHGEDDTGPNQSWWTGRYRFLRPEENESSRTEQGPRLFSILQEQGIATLRVISRSRLEGIGKLPSLRFPRKRLFAALAGITDRSRALIWVDLPGLAPPWPVLRSERLRRYFRKNTSEDDRAPLPPWFEPPYGLVNLDEDAARERLQATYAAMVTFFDAQVGRLLRDLQRLPWYNESALIFTADRGLSLGEHGAIGDAASGLHEEVIHLPLLLRLPGNAEGGRRVAALTQAVDLFPTLLDLLDMPAAGTDGQSLMALARGEKESIREYAIAALAREGAIEYALRTPEWAYLMAPPRLPRLYVKPDDRWEVNDVLQHHAELAAGLEQKMQEVMTAKNGPGSRSSP